ncbi:MAG: hypothetical protein HY704_16165 [Gemmatimonadetes bacterium]|nr:hypothetical protein [Gemmatimonadota bacterium]
MSVAALPGPDVVLGRVRRYLAVRALSALTLWAGAALTLFLLGGWLIAGGDGWGSGTAAPLLLDVVVVALGATGLATLWHVWTARLAEPRVTAAVERSAGLADGAFLGAVELARATPRGISPGLARAAEREVSARIGVTATGVLAGDLGRVLLRWERLGAAAFGALAVLVAVAAITAPQRARTAWGGLLAPLRAFSAPAYAALEVEPGDAEVPRGARVEITVRAPGRERVTLRWQAAGEVARVRALHVVGDRAHFTFDSVTAAIEYGAHAPDGAFTRIFRIRPVDPLFLAELTVEVLYPQYSGRPSESFAGEIPLLEIPAGTRLRIDGRASRMVSTAALVGPRGTVAAAFAAEGSRFRGAWTPVTSGRYEWRLADAAGAVPGAPIPPLQIRIAGDAAPEIALLFPGRDTVMPLSLRQPLVIRARDDYGLERVELVSYRVSSFGDRGEPVVEKYAADGAAAVALSPVLDVNGRRLLPGDTVRYYARVAESGPEGKSARTPEFALRLPDLTELSWEARRAVDDLANEMAAAARRAEQAQRATSALARGSATRANAAARPGAGTRSGSEERPSGLDYRQSEDVRRAIQEQKELLAQLDSIRAGAAELAQALEEAGLTDPELRARLSELQKLAEEVVTPELRRKLQDVADALADLDPERVRSALEALAREQDALRSRVEEALELFRRAALEQQFRATSQEAAELARQEEALAEEMAGERDLARRAEQQRALENRAEALREELRELSERLAQAGEQSERPAAERAGELAEQAREAMSASAEGARGGDAQRAEAGAREAGSLMRQAAGTLEQARSDLTAGWRQAVQTALDRAASDALALARTQASMMQSMSSGERSQLEDVRGTEAAVLQGVKQMAENLARASRTSAMIDRSLGASLGRAMDALEDALAAMTGDAGPVRVPRAEAEAALAALNEVALRALANGSQVGQSQGGTGVEEALEQLAELAGQQGALYRQSGVLAPLQLGAEALAQQLEQLAALQRAIGQELAQLAERPETAEQVLGNLGGMAQEAEELAQRLRRGDLDRETVERQGQLFHRLLDAGRTLERDEWSEEREAQRPGPYDPRRPPPVEKSALGTVRYAVPDPVELLRLTPAHRQMVLEYFERLNRQPPSER